MLLRHILPDGSCHVDWLLAPEGHPGPDERVLMAWRLAEADGLRLSEAEEPFACEAIRLPDHRAMYLTYEGVVGGARGSVERVASGSWSPVSDRDRSIDLVTRFRTLWAVRGERLGDAPEPADRGDPPLGRWRLVFERVPKCGDEAAAAPNG